MGAPTSLVYTMNNHPQIPANFDNNGELEDHFLDLLEGLNHDHVITVVAQDTLAANEDQLPDLEEYTVNYASK